MLRSMTIGSFYQTDSIIHRLDARVKIVAVLVFLVSLFLFKNFSGYLIVTVFLGAVIVMSRVPLSHILKGMKAIFFLLLFTAFFNLFFTDGDVLWQWSFLKITYQGVRQAVFIAMRLIYLVVGSSMLTYTTTPGQLTNAIESLLGWLKIFKVPVHDFAMMMSLALRFIPLLLEETNRIMDAQSARGADFTGGGVVKRLRSYVSILVPLFVSATRRAYELGLAMEARCYNGGKGRTKLKPLKYRWTDFLAYLVTACYLTVVIIVERMGNLF